ncbi:MAG: zinc ABC transporter substrate-binding protein [Candidatus Aenigmarchaeota archaeon]|nr:zinc ABC transporter substrate-binding protein [Candidatus Aenigmarchaeota archaeon]
MKQCLQKKINNYFLRVDLIKIKLENFLRLNLNLCATKKILILTVLTMVFISGCTQYPSEKSQDKINVIVSILPQKAFAKAVGGDYVNVNELIPPGGSPATYDLKPSDLVNIEKADIYFRIGHIPFEKSHADKLTALNPNMKVVDTSKNVKLKYAGENERGIDPHIWLSPIKVKKQVDAIAEALSQIDPENAEEYNQNAINFKKELDDLNAELKGKFAEIGTKKLLVFHPAWGYFADEYGLEQIAIEHEGKEPTAKQLKELIDKAKEEEIKVIFVQSQFNKDIAESIAKEIDAVVVSINPLSEDYLNNLRNVGETITKYLNK